MLNTWYSRYAAIASATAVTVGGYEWINWAGLTASDWGTWVGGLGTVATLAMTIRLATADRRRAREEAHARAVVAAASLSIRLDRLGRTLQNATDVFLDDSTERNVGEYIANAGAIEGDGTWTDDEILPLMVLPHHICARLAGVRPLLEQTIADMKYVAENYSYSWAKDIIEKRQGDITAGLVISRDAVQLATTVCRATVRAALRS